MLLQTRSDFVNKLLLDLMGLLTIYFPETILSEICSSSHSSAYFLSLSESITLSESQLANVFESAIKYVMSDELLLKDFIPILCAIGILDSF